MEDRKPLYEDQAIVVFDNGSGEIFVQLKLHKKATVRISPCYNHFKITCNNGTLIPTSLNGLSCVAALPGKVKD